MKILLVTIVSFFGVFAQAQTFVSPKEMELHFLSDPKAKITFLSPIDFKAFIPYKYQNCDQENIVHPWYRIGQLSVQIEALYSQLIAGVSTYGSQGNDSYRYYTIDLVFDSASACKTFFETHDLRTASLTRIRMSFQNNIAKKTYALEWSTVTGEVKVYAWGLSSKEQELVGQGLVTKTY